MKEYTYTNKAYLGIKEGVVPPAPQYLWINSEDDKLYKFGDGGWEIINNDNLYVADFTIEDLDGLSETIPLLYTNARALISALAAGKAIGIRQGNNESMSIASAYKQGISILLTVISGSGTIYKVHIDSSGVIDPEVADNETGRIHWGLMQVVPTEPTFTPFNMKTVVSEVEGGMSRVLRDKVIAILETNKPLFIRDDLSGVVPASYSITKQDENPTAVDIDIVYNNGSYHIHWGITDDPALYLSSDTVSYTPFSDVYIVTEFTVDDIGSQSLATSPKLTISRAFLDAAYKGLPIMVRVVPSEASHVPITVHRINNPNEGTAIRFKVQQENIEYLVSCIYNRALIGDDGVLVDATITSYNLVDWDTNDSLYPGYIANRTHHLGSRESVTIGNRFSLANTKGTHYIDNYKLLYDGKLYDLPTKQGQRVSISSYFTIIFNGYNESGNISTYTFTSNAISSSESLPSQTFEIHKDYEGSGHKTLDEFYLPDGAKPWKIIEAIPQVAEGRAYHFNDISIANIASGDNVIRNKVIYEVANAGIISIGTLLSDSILEFKIIVVGSHQFSIDSKQKVLWENGERPDTSSATLIIYSFLVLNGTTFASAKVYGYTK